MTIEQAILQTKTPEDWQEGIIDYWQVWTIITITTYIKMSIAYFIKVLQTIKSL